MPRMGVYAIICTNTGDQYIGASSNIEGRWQAHISGLRSGSHPRWQLQAAWNTYGESAFTFRLLEEATTTDEVAKLETHYLATERHEFNPNSRGGAGIVTPSDRKPVSFRLSERARTLLEETADYLGCSPTNALQIMIHQYSRGKLNPSERTYEPRANRQPGNFPGITRSPNRPVTRRIRDESRNLLTEANQ